MIGEMNGTDRLKALEVHRDYLKKLKAESEVTDVDIAFELAGTEHLIAVMTSILNQPTTHWVEVIHSRVVHSGAVGKVVYANRERGHCRIEFGTGERVSCGYKNVEVIDWEPLPSFIPMVGERVWNAANRLELIAVEWSVDWVKVHPPGLPQDVFNLDRQYIVRYGSFVKM